MAIYLIALMGLLNHVGHGGSRLLMSLYALELGAEQFTIGTLIAVKALCPMLLGIYAGKLVDRVGARLPMLGGSAGVAISLVLPYLFPGLATLYVSIIVLGVAFQFFVVAAQGITGAVGRVEDRARNYSILAIGFSLAAFIGPLIAGFSIDYVGYLPAFLVLASTAVVAVLLLWLKPGILPNVTLRTGDGKRKQSAMDLLHNSRLRNTYVVGGLISAGHDLYQFYFPIYGNAIGLSASVIGIVSAVFAVAILLIRVVLPYIARKMNEFAIMTYATAASGVSLLLFPLFEDPFMLAVASFLLGLGFGCGQPMSMVLVYNLAPAGRAAEAAGVRVVFNNFTHLVVPLVFGALGTALGVGPVFISGSGLMLAGSCYGYFQERAAFQRAA